MQAMVLRQLGAALEWTELADRSPGPGEIRVNVNACGVCRTDLHVLDGGDLESLGPPARLLDSRRTSRTFLHISRVE